MALRQAEATREDRRLADRSQEVKAELTALAGAQAGVRGYVITGDDRYLDSYRQSLPRIERGRRDLAALVAGDPERRDRLGRIGPRVDLRLGLLAETAAARGGSGFEAARTIVASDRGRVLMDVIRGLFGAMQGREREAWSVRIASASAAARASWAALLVGTAVELAILALVFRAVLVEGTRRRTERSLRESEERFRGACEAATIGMALVGLDGRFLAVNRSFCEIVSYPEAELLATDFQSITHPDDLAADLGLVRQLLAGAIRNYQLEKRYVHRLGREVWVRLSGSLVRDAEGRPLHFVAQAEDVTARRRAEAALEDQTLLLGSILDQMADAVVAVDPDGEILVFNQAARRLHGCGARSGSRPGTGPSGSGSAWPTAGRPARSTTCRWPGHCRASRSTAASCSSGAPGPAGGPGWWSTPGPCSGPTVGPGGPRRSCTT